MTSTATDGDRGQIIGEITTQSTIDRTETDIHQLTVSRASGGQMELLVADSLLASTALEAGRQYVFSDVVYARTRLEGVTDDCPSCGGQLRRGSAIDALEPNYWAAVEDGPIDDVVAVATAHTRVHAIRPDDNQRDDWRPQEQPAAHPEHSPEFVCQDCGQITDSHHLEGHDEEMVLNQISANTAAQASPDQSLGMATGGAADATNFRENIRNGYTPRPDAMATEGLFYDYHFDTDGTAPETDALFAPRYATAVSEHPLSGATERYVAVGLDSNLTVDQFERPQLDLVAVLDVSGSMHSQFDQYYYDEHGRRRETDAGDETKLEAAIESLCALTEQLNDDDRLGVVLYNNRSHVAKPLRDVGATDMPAIRRHIREISAGGGTNLADGFEAAWEMLAGTADENSEQRVVFLTDMMPNTGATGESELTSLFAEAAADGIHTTFIGVGLDENADLAATLSGLRGANHYFVTSGSEFSQRLADEFEYMVTPLVYDLTLEVDGTDDAIADIYGSPTAAPATGRLMNVGTLFPSPQQDGETRGGIVLLRLEATADSEPLDIIASWRERDGTTHEQRVSVEVPTEGETYAHDGVRKAVVLARYARVLREWTETVHERANRSTGVDDWLFDDGRSEHERESVPLVVPEDVASRLKTVREYLANELAILDDETLQQEIDSIDQLLEAPAKPTEADAE